MISDNVIDAWEHFKSIFMGIINNIAPMDQYRNTEIDKRQ